jgi:hypothetical protein
MTREPLHVAYDAKSMRNYNMSKLISLLLVIACIGFTPFQSVLAAEKIVMVMPLSTTDTLGKWVELIFTEAFHRLNLELEV